MIRQPTITYQHSPRFSSIREAASAYTRLEGYQRSVSIYQHIQVNGRLHVVRPQEKTSLSTSPTISPHRANAIDARPLVAAVSPHNGKSEDGRQGREGNEQLMKALASTSSPWLCIGEAKGTELAISKKRFNQVGKHELLGGGITYLS